jgi:hypothetical protein
MSLIKEKIQCPCPTLKDMMTRTWWEDHALCCLHHPRQTETIWNPEAQETTSPLKTLSAAIWDPPGSGGRKEEGTQNIKSSIRARSFNAPTSTMGWYMESHMRWGRREAVSQYHALVIACHILDRISHICLQHVWSPLILGY